MVCKTSERSYHNSQLTKTQILENLAKSFIIKATPILKEIIPNLRILRRKITSKFTGIPLLTILKQQGFLINENITNYDH
jgi:hypothetical protein